MYRAVLAGIAVALGAAVAFGILSPRLVLLHLVQNSLVTQSQKARVHFTTEVGGRGAPASFVQSVSRNFPHLKRSFVMTQRPWMVLGRREGRETAALGSDEHIVTVELASGTLPLFVEGASGESSFGVLVRRL
ncbi:hypothetical protein J6590_026109 [Homalodisca vitripennis]|nr:hypothetical protein J6590_026109 [Homalodisca vitripennis]